MKLPEQMPIELKARILASVHGCACEDCQYLLDSHYSLIANHFNNLPADCQFTLNPIAEIFNDSASQFRDVLLYSENGCFSLGTMYLEEQEGKDIPYICVGEAHYTYEDLSKDYTHYSNLPRPPKE